MTNDILELQQKFKEIKRKGWIQNLGNGTGSMGRTFEALIGREENSLEIPDFGEVEIKTQKVFTRGYINLFNMAPSGKHYHEIERLKNLYGYPDKQFPEYKVLNNHVFCTCRTNIGTKYQFMLKLDRNERRIYLCIFDQLGIFIEKDVYWDFDIIKEKLYRKLKTLAFIKGDRKFKDGVEYYKYFDMKIYTLKDFSTFISLIESGIIRINFKVNVFKSGRRKGQIHDHGTSFDIKECDILKLYDVYKI